MFKENFSDPRNFHDQFQAFFWCASNNYFFQLRNIKNLSETFETEVVNKKFSGCFPQKVLLVRFAGALQSSVLLLRFNQLFFQSSFFENLSETFPLRGQTVHWILCLYVPGFQGQVFKHVKNLVGTIKG